MNWLDRITAAGTRNVARSTSRRHFLARLGVLLAGAATLPLLPVRRGSAESPVNPRAMQPGETGDPLSCDYWRYCSIDGFLCTACGGTTSACPPGSKVGTVTWIGTCRNPADDKDYIISYNDCCGPDASTCGRAYCNTNEGDTPVYMPATSNDINWCQGNVSNGYHCTIAAVLGHADEG